MGLVQHNKYLKKNLSHLHTSIYTQSIVLTEKPARKKNVHLLDEDTVDR